MTIAYNSKVSESGVLTFFRLLAIWRGSVYKLIWKEFLVYLFLFYMLNFVYRFALTEHQKIIFEGVVLYCDAFLNLIPLSFVLGFFVSTVVSRWWAQFEAIPFPDSAALSIGSMIVGNDLHGRLLRRTLIRYLNLTALLIYRNISRPIKKRFPTLNHLVDAGFITNDELQSYEDLPCPHGKWWVPCVWACNLLTKAYQENRIIDLKCYQLLFNLVTDFKNNCGNLYAYDWIQIPLVYTQTVTLATYTFFLASLMGRQLLDGQKKYPNHDDVYFPIFTFLQFFFYMGWFKVAEELINPLGEDEDDFDINWIIDRNFQVSMLMVDTMHKVIPPLEKDMHWNDIQPVLPYTAAAQEYKKTPWMGSTAHTMLNPDEMNYEHGELSTEDTTPLLGNLSKKAIHSKNKLLEKWPSLGSLKNLSSFMNPTSQTPPKSNLPKTVTYYTRGSKNAKSPSSNTVKDEKKIRNLLMMNQDEEIKTKKSPTAVMYSTFPPAAFGISRFIKRNPPSATNKRGAAKHAANSDDIREAQNFMLTDTSGKNFNTNTPKETKINESENKDGGNIENNHFMPLPVKTRNVRFGEDHPIESIDMLHKLTQGLKKSILKPTNKKTPSSIPRDAKANSENNNNESKDKTTDSNRLGLVMGDSKIDLKDIKDKPQQ